MKENERKMIENVKKPTFSIIFLVKKYCKKDTLLL